MKVKVKKLENISEVSIPVQISPLTTVYLAKGQKLEDQDVYNLQQLSGLVKTEQDLTEVNPINEDKKKLYD